MVNLGNSAEKEDDENVPQESQFKAVRIEGCNYQLKEEEIVQWLELYGKPMGSIQEETFEDENDDGAENGNGTYVVKMRLTRSVPELVPMFGQRIRISYQGTKKMCKNCYNYHREDSKENRVKWNTYEELFKLNHPEIPAEMIDKPGPLQNGKIEAGWEDSLEW